MALAGMRAGHCPKCGADDVRSGSKVALKHRSNTIPVSMLNHASLNNYVCVQCGYVESYIADRGSLDRIAEKWPRADG